MALYADNLIGQRHFRERPDASFDVALFLWSAGTCPRFPLFSLDLRRLNGFLWLEIDTLDQHSVFFPPYGTGKLRQVGALHSAQHQNAPASDVRECESSSSEQIIRSVNSGAPSRPASSRR